MALNNNEIFYRKLLNGIILFCCLFFVVVLNLMRYEHLIRNTPIQKSVHVSQSSYLISVSFTSAQNTHDPRMIFLFNMQNKHYFSSVFSPLKHATDQNIILINCTENNTNDLKQFLSPRTIIEAPCHIEENNLESMLAVQYNIVVLSLNENDTHHEALRAAQRFNLKPNLKITEITNANRRL